MPLIDKCETSVPFVCNNIGTVDIQTIIEKVDMLRRIANCQQECCNFWSGAEQIKTLRVDNRLYLTNTGIAPVEVSRPDPIPEEIETWMNHILDEKIFHNHTQILEMYFNDVLVYLNIFELELPQYTAGDIDLRAFIDANNPDNIPNIIITNNLIQPSLTTGDLSGLNIKLVNNGEFQGTSSSGYGMILTSPMMLDNLGWIRGAGGNGGNGSSHGNYSKIVGGWTVRHQEPDNCGLGIISPRYWHSSGNMAWRTKDSNGNCAGLHGPHSTNIPFDERVGDFGWYGVLSWGNQGITVFKAENFGNGIIGRWTWRNGESDGGATGSISYMIYSTYYLTGGAGGIGGTGIGFGVPLDSGRTLGSNASSSGPTSGFNTSDGVTLLLPTVADYSGGDGGHGGDWGMAGTSSGEGNPGQPAGNAIEGSSFLVSGSVTGNVNGSII